MKKLSLAILIIISALFSLSFYGCANNVQVYTTFAFGSSVRIEVHGKPISNELKEQMSFLLTSLENTYSVNVEGSVISNINANISTSLTDENKQIFKLCSEYYTLSNGKFNPAVYPLNRLWHFAKGTEVSKENFTPPTPTQINALLDSGVLDFSTIKIENNLLTKQRNNTMLDLGGMLKGYACDKLSSLLYSYGYEKGYVSLGSSSIHLLDVEKLSIRHPQNGNAVILDLNGKSIKNQSVSTSGDYEKYYDYEGKRYSHIIDTTTGKPYDTGVISATMISDDGAFADAMTTALCLSNFSTENKRENELVSLINSIIKKDSSASVYALYCKGENKVLITNKEQGKDFTLLDNNYEIVNI